MAQPNTKRLAVVEAHLAETASQALPAGLEAAVGVV